MTHLDSLSAWVTSHESQLQAVGKVTFTTGPLDRPNPSAHLSVETASVSVELLLWATGEAEFNRSSENDSPLLEHVEVESPEEFAALLGRVFAAVDCVAP